MARRFLTDIELLGFSVLNPKIHPVSATPAGLGVGDKGRVWFNTTTDRLMVWDGTTAIDLLDLAASVGNITASRVTDFTTAVQAIPWGSLADPTAPVDAGGQRITSAADPTTSSDVVNLQFLQAELAGLSSGQVLKGAVRVAVTTPVTLATPGATLDGVTMVSGDVVLLTGQSTAGQNGPYVWTGAATPLTRATNWDSTAEAALGSYWIVREGTQGDTFAMLTNDAAITISGGTASPAPTFAFRGQQTPTAGDGLTFGSNTYAVGAGTGITVAADAVGIDTARVLRKWQGGIPNASTTVDTLPITVAGAQVTFNHSAANDNPLVVVRYGTSPPDGGTARARVEIEDVAVDANSVRIVLPAAPQANHYTFMLAA